MPRFYLGHLRVADSSRITPRGRNGIVTIPVSDGGIVACGVLRNSVVTPGPEINCHWADGKVSRGKMAIVREAHKRELISL